MIKTKCFFCKKKIILRWKCQLKVRNYCDRYCLGKSRRIPFNPCQNCGKPVNWRGKKIRACSLFCRNMLNTGPGNPHFKGGEFISIKGYKQILDPRDDRRKRYIEEHRYFMELKIGRRLKPRFEVVHHINGNKTDNRLCNLVLTSISEHSKIHNLERPRCYKTGEFLSPKFKGKFKKHTRKRSKLGRYLSSKYTS